MIHVLITENVRDKFCVKCLLPEQSICVPYCHYTHEQTFSDPDETALRQQYDLGLHCLLTVNSSTFQQNKYLITLIQGAYHMNVEVSEYFTKEYPKVLKYWDT